MVDCLKEATVIKSPSKRPSKSKGEGAPKKRYSTVTVPMSKPMADAFVASAKAEGESLIEFVYGGCCMLLAQDLRILEKFLAGFALSAPDVKRLGQIGRAHV